MASSLPLFFGAVGARGSSPAVSFKIRLAEGPICGLQNYVFTLRQCKNETT